MTVRPRLCLLAAALAVTVGTATSCTDVNGTDGKDFVTSDGVVVEVAKSDRAKPVEVSGETLDGTPLDLTDWRGQVVVVNVWGAWCGECLSEAPKLVEAAQELPAGTEMVGIDIRDLGKDQPKGFEQTFGITYPSIYDPGSETLLEFPAPYNPRDTPSTMVLDREGRVAAVVRGAMPSKLTLLDLVQKVSDEGA
jgi:thiol-disulfide isomerase/thioredoxin